MDAGDRDITAMRHAPARALAAAASVLAFAFGSALFSSAGIALFLAIWLVPVVRWPRLATAALRYPPLWLLPALALASVLWSRDPVDTARSAAELTAFTLAAITLARSTSERTMVVSLTFALAAVVAVSLASGQGDVPSGTATFMLRGVFGSKNALSLFCGMLAVTGLAGALDRGMAPAARLFCLSATVLGAATGLASRSVGGVAAAVLALAILVGAMALARLPAPARRTAMAAALVAMVLAGAALMTLGKEQSSDLLLLVGKTPDLTGRTYLWTRAHEAIADRPWLGVGYQAYFRPQFVDAQGIYRYGGIAAEAGFHFHNLYLQVAVELGLVGVVVVGIALAWVAIAALRRYDRQPDAPAALMLALVMLLTARMALEVDFLAPFSVGGLVFALVYVLAQRPATASAYRSAVM